MFFSKAGIKYEILDILVETVIPQLSEIDDEGLPKLISENREKLEKHFEDGLIPHITDLRVKAQDGKFYKISETIYIDCEKDEPFPYIELPNQITFGSAEEPADRLPWPFRVPGPNRAGRRRNAGTSWEKPSGLSVEYMA